MNAKAKAPGMTHTRYMEPTGLSPRNVSSARDLTKLAIATEHYPLTGKFSTTDETVVSLYSSRLFPAIS